MPEDRVLQFVGELERAVRGRLPAEHWQITLDFDSVKLVLVGKAPPATERARSLVQGESAGCFFTRELINSTPDEHHERVIRQRVAELARLADAL